MNPPDRVPAHLADMLAFVRELRQLLAPLSLDEYKANRVLNLAVEKPFINLGEAAARVPDDRRGAFDPMPWRQIIGLRNVLAHGYEQVEHETLYITVCQELPDVESALSKALAQFPSS
jgi:uncharacterized protein with HEPN domain